MSLTTVDSGLISSGAITLTTQVTGTLPEANGGTGTTVGYCGFKNRIINGGFPIWQRGTSGFSTSTGVYTADRWLNYYGTNTVTQSSDVPNGAFQYSMSISGSGNATISQRIESKNAYDLYNNSVSLSFWIKQTTGSGSNAIQVSLSYPNSVDAFTGVTTAIGSAVNITTTTAWAQYSMTFTSMPAGVANGLQVIIGSSSAGSVVFLITGVQLEKGSTATSFDYRPYGTELALCQRYLPAFNGTTVVASGWCSSATQGYIEVSHIVTPRTAPTGVTTSAMATFTIYGGSATSVTPTAITLNAGGSQGSRLSVATASGLTNAAGTALYANSASSQILFTGCEL
jgi:hypothetical protein